MRRLFAFVLIVVACSTPLFAAGGRWVAYSQGVLALTFVAITLMVGIMSLVWNFRHRYKGKDTFWKYAFKKPLVKLALASVGLVLLVNLFVGNSLSNNRYENLAFAKLRKLSRLGASINRDLACDYPYLANYHYDYIAAYYEADAWTQTGEPVGMHDDEQLSPVPFYQRILYHESAKLRDYGLLGMGMSEYYESMPNLALQQLMQMRDTSLPYRNLFIGRLYADWGQPVEASYYFRREFEAHGAVDLAAHDYAAMVYRYQRDSIDRIRALVEDPEIGPHVPNYMARNLYVREAALGSYISVILSDWWGGVNWIGFFGALLGVLVWASFLRKVEGRGRYSWPLVAAVVAMGGLFCFLALPLYDYLEFVFDFKQTGDPWQDFLFCWFGIGAVEEFVKFLPLVLLWKTTRIIRTPLDFIIYASLLGLGFAFVENLMYFEAGSENIIHARLLTAVVAHIFLSATVAFSIVLAKYRFKKALVPLVLAGFLFASLIHGLYDFWLLNDAARVFIFLTYALLLYATFQYAAYLNNCLNHASHYNPRNLPDPNGLAEYLLIGLVSLLMFEFLAMTVVYGPVVATAEFLQSLTMSSFLMFFLVLNLTNIDVVRGEWTWVRPWSFSSRKNYNSAVGKRLELLAGKRQGLLDGMLPARGEVIARLSVAGDNRYFLFEFEKPALLLGHPLRYVLLKSKEKEDVIEPGFNMEVGMIAFRDPVSLMRHRHRKEDFKFLDFAVIR